MLLYQTRKTHALGKESAICLSRGEIGKSLQSLDLISIWETMIKNENTDKNASASAAFRFHSHNEPAVCPGDILVQSMDVNTRKYPRASL